MYDAIVIGARAAGAPTAMLLARKGYKVLLLDRARFPSDTLSTHQVQLKGGAALKRWGLFERVVATNCPPVRSASFHLGDLSFRGDYFPLEGLDAVICPRRTVLDKILVDAAVQAGAELREDLLIEELVIEDGHVCGVRGRAKSGSAEGAARMEERARIVIGADGKHSLVARTVGAVEYKTQPILTCAYYTYWEGLALTSGELHSAAANAVGMFPTNDGLTIIYTGYPIAEFQAIREDIEGRFWKTMAIFPGLSDRLRAGRPAERFYGTADLPAFYRRPFGPGWALVGDAGMTMDPITGQGIGDAFVDAEGLAVAIDSGLSGSVSLDQALTEHEQRRNRDTLPMYGFTAQLAAFGPPPIEQQVLFAALARNPEAASRFFGVLTGSVPMTEFFSPPNLFRIMGVAGMGRVLADKLLHRQRSNANQPGNGSNIPSGV